MNSPLGYWSLLWLRSSAGGQCEHHNIQSDWVNCFTPSKLLSAKGCFQVDRIFVPLDGRQVKSRYLQLINANHVTSSAIFRSFFRFETLNLFTMAVVDRQRPSQFEQIHFRVIVACDLLPFFSLLSTPSTILQLLPPKWECCQQYKRFVKQCPSRLGRAIILVRYQM